MRTHILPFLLWGFPVWPLRAFCLFCLPRAATSPTCKGRTHRYVCSIVGIEDITVPNRTPQGNRQAI